MEDFLLLIKSSVFIFHKTVYLHCCQGTSYLGKYFFYVCFSHIGGYIYPVTKMVPLLTVFSEEYDLGLAGLEKIHRSTLEKREQALLEREDLY